MIEKKSFTGGLSTDRDGAYLQPNQYLNALNIRVTSNEEGSEGVLTNIKGNTEVTFTLPSGTNTCIGSFEDAENHRVFYFLHNSNDEHLIMCYFHKENVIRKVFENNDFGSSANPLNFSTSNLITGVGMNDDLLFFTDGETEPKRINVERGLKKHDSSYTQLKTYDVFENYGVNNGANFSDSVITIARPAPIFPPTTNRLKDTSVKTNNISDMAFHFAFRYVYADGEVSGLSPDSKVSRIPNPDTATSEQLSNVIEVKLPTLGIVNVDVVAIEVFVRIDGGQDYFLFETIDDYSVIGNYGDDPSDAAPILRFTNDGVKTPISASDAVLSANTVPVKAKSLECARQRVFLGNVTKGLNNLNESGIKLNSSVIPLELLAAGSLTADWIVIQVNTLDLTQGLPSIVTTYERYYIVNGSTIDGVYRVNADGNPPTITEAIKNEFTGVNALDSSANGNWQAPAASTSTATGNTTVSQLILSLRIASANNALVQKSYFQLTKGGGQSTSTSVTGFTSATAVTISENTKLWKSSGQYKFGIVFKDKFGRNGRLIDFPDSVSIPERDALFSRIVKQIRWTLPSSNQHLYIPDWAHAFSVVRTRELTRSFFLNLQAKKIYYAPNLTATLTDSDRTFSQGTSQFLAVDLSSIHEATLGYNYSEGDLLRVHAGNFEATYQIVHQSGNFIYASLPETPAVAVLSVNGHHYNIEIFTPRLLNEEEPFFEIGECFSITNPGASNRSFGSTTGIIKGDIVIKQRGFGTQNNYNLEFQSADISKNTWIQTSNKGYASTRFQQVHKPHAIIFSENRLVGTLLNGLSTFNALDEKNIPSESGAIQKLILTSKVESLGNNMLAIGTNETASIYLGESQLQGGGGSAVVAIQTGVIGSVQILRGSYGTLHPESVVSQNNKVYWLDVLNGTCVQYDVNGLMPIGDRGIGSFFRERCDLIVTQNKTGCHGGFDANENEYILTIPEVSDVEQEYFNDYVNLYSISANILNGYQGSDYNATFDISVSIKKNRKYRVKVSNLTLDSAVLDAINLEKADGTLIGSFSATGANSSIQVGDFIEFTASEDASSLKVELSQISGSVGSDDVIKFQTFEFRPSYYKLDNGDATTIAYSEDVRAWTTFYSYAPENMVNVGTQFITFKGGGLWKHDTNNTRNNFYGTQYVSRVSSISKEVPSAVKTFSNISVEGNVPPSFTHFRTESKYMDRDSSGNIPANPTYSDYIQSSDLSDSEFRQLEGVYYAGILRDRLQPAPSTYNEDTYNTNMMSGQKLTNQFMLFTLEFDNTSKVSVRFANIGFNAQRGHKV